MDSSAHHHPVGARQRARQGPRAWPWRRWLPHQTFWIEELLARIRVALNIPPKPWYSTNRNHNRCMVIDLTRHIVTRSGKEVKLTATEFNLIAYLASNPTGYWRTVPSWHMSGWCRCRSHRISARNLSVNCAKNWKKSRFSKIFNYRTGCRVPFYYFRIKPLKILIFPQSVFVKAL